MDTLITIYMILNAFYIITIILVITGLLRLRSGHPEITPQVSVVIAARNEERRIRPALESLERLNYPEDRYEVILVDDASEDKTADIIQSFVVRHANWSMIRMTRKSDQLRGKKKALKVAIEQAKGEIIFTTDADCVVPANWLTFMVRYFSEDTDMVLGHSPLIRGKGFLRRLLEFDNLFSAITASAPAKLGFAMTSVGRNLAYRRAAYLNVGGFDALKKFRSGDDVHLTERFRMKGKGNIDFCAHPETFVFTVPPSSGKELFHQQIRKNSKTLNKSFPTIVLSMILFVYHLFLIAMPFLYPEWRHAWLYTIGGKFVLEFLALLTAAVKFRKGYLIKWFIPMQVMYPLYIIFFSLLGILQIYEWKK